MKKILVKNLFSLLLVVCLLTSTVYAWWIKSDSISDIKVVTAKMESEIALYKGIDFNYDGLLDLDANGNELFTDKLESNNFDFRNITKDGSVTNHSIIPTEIHTWKVVVTNKGNAVGLVSMKLVVEDESLKDIFKYFVLIVEDKQYFLNEVFENNVVTIYESDTQIKPNESNEYIIQFELLEYSVLEEKGYTNISYEEYQSLQGIQSIISGNSANIFLDVILSTIN